MRKRLVLRLCKCKTGRYAGMLAAAAFRDRSIRIERLLCDDRKRSATTFTIHRNHGFGNPKPTTECAKSVFQCPGQSLRSGDGLVEGRSSIGVYCLSRIPIYRHRPFKTVTRYASDPDRTDLKRFCIESYSRIVGQILTAEGVSSMASTSGRTQSNASSCWHSR